MGWQVVKQPNGNYSVWSTVVDGFVFIDATAEEIEQVHVDQAIEKAKEDAARQLARANGDPGVLRTQFDLTWEEAARMHNERYPDEAVEVREQTNPCSEVPALILGPGEFRPEQK